jgi:hypothetical protein
MLAQIPAERLADIARIFDDQYVRFGFFADHQHDLNMGSAETIRKCLLSQSIAGTKRAQFGDQIFR